MNNTITMKIFLTACLLLTVTVSFAQSPVKRIINNCGNTYVASGMRLRVSVGEPIVGMHSNTTASLAQGFLTGKPAAVIIPEVPVTGYTLYPNPFTYALLIKGDVSKVKQLQLTDAAGRNLAMVAVQNATVNIKGMAAGVYMARLLGENNNVLYFVKLIKL